MAVGLIDTVVQIDSPPRSSESILAQIVLDQGWSSSRLEAAEKAERWDRQFRNRLRATASERHSAGRVCSFDFNSSSDYMIQGSAYIEPGVDSTDLAESKRRRHRYAEYLAFLRQINPREFEALCAGILGLLGIREPTLTSHGHDEGIDFYGQLELGSALAPETLPGLTSILRVWMIGQAKHYPSGQAATPEIRELVGAVELAQAGAYSRLSTPYSNLRIKLCDPVFFLFFTTGTISRPGWRLLDSSGAIGMDGEMLAAFLAENEIGVVEGAFDAPTLQSWVDGHSG